MKQPIAITFRSIQIKANDYIMLDGQTPVTEPYYMKWVSRPEHLSFQEFEALLKQYNNYRKLLQEIEDRLKEYLKAPFSGVLSGHKMEVER